MEINAKSTQRRPAFWGKSMARYLNGSEPSTSPPGKPVVQTDATAESPKGQKPGPTTSDPAAIDRGVLSKLGLPQLAAIPREPRLLAEALIQDDAHDGATDLDEFSRGIRRAVRLRVAFEAKLHRRESQTWMEWVSSHFQAGYPCYQRYHVAADLQIELLTRGLPELTNEAQARAVAPFRKHAIFWETLTKIAADGALPPGNELRRQIEKRLGFAQAPVTARIRLHRTLERIARAAAGATDDPLVAKALGLVARAVALLEAGGKLP